VFVWLSQTSPGILMIQSQVRENSCENINDPTVRDPALLVNSPVILDC
jgi:hypothetical protein